MAKVVEDMVLGNHKNTPPVWLFPLPAPFVMADRIGKRAYFPDRSSYLVSSYTFMGGIPTSTGRATGQPEQGELVMW